MNWRRKWKQITAVIAAGAMVAGNMTILPAKAEEKTRYPYTIFASAQKEGAITINADNFCLNGDMVTNGTISASGNLQINGTKKESAEESMMYLFHAIDDAYFTGTDYVACEGDYVLEETNINISTPVAASGEMNLEGNINLNTAIKALETITLTGEVKNTNNSVIYSKYGDIIIDSTNVNLSGLIYAPFGHVKIQAQNLGLNNIIVIAETVTIISSSVNVNYSSQMAEFVGTESELLDIPDDERKYLEGRELPDVTTEENSSEETTEDNSTEENTTEDSSTETTTEDWDAKQKRYEELMSDFDNWNSYLDTDEDGLPDELEELIGSDKILSDTDGDGLDDYYEFLQLGTSLTEPDTDENGISDAEEDFDGDGLNNAQEYMYGTLPWESDTDQDGLSDGDEVLVYGTDPLKPDTDGDGLIDGDEPAMGFDPTKPDTDENGIPDGKERIEQSVTYEVENKECAVTEIQVDMVTSGSLTASTTIESIMDTDYGCSNVAGLVGEPFEITTTCTFETATLSYKVDQTKLGETEFNDLLFLWYDEDNKQMVELETEHDAETGIVSTETTHFSKYMLVDAKKWAEIWKHKFPYEERQQSRADACYTYMYFFGAVPTVLKDTAGNTEDIKGKQLTEYHVSYISQTRQIINAAINTMHENDRVGYVCDCGLYHSNKQWGSGMYDYLLNNELKENPKKYLRDKINGNELGVYLRADWGYDDADAQMSGNDNVNIMVWDYIVTAREDAKLGNTVIPDRRIILVCGGNIGNISENTLALAKKENIRIDTLMIGDYAYAAPLIKASQATGGQFYKVEEVNRDNVDELISKMKIGELPENESGLAGGSSELPDEFKIDTDEDGIPDVVEREGMRNQYGMIVYTDPEKKDTDGDKLTDGEEIDPTKRNKQFSNIMTLNVPKNADFYYMKSSPNNPDTDNDGYTDYEEVRTYHSNPLFSDVHIYELQHDYIAVNFIDGDGNSQISYGGNQGWFGEEYKQNNIEKYSTIDSYGCGLISISDILLYLASVDSKYSTDMTDLIRTDNGAIEYNSYIDYISRMEKSFFHVRDIDLIDGTKWTGIDGLSIAYGVNKYNWFYNVDLHSYWGGGTDKMLKNIEEMLKNDIPVTLSANAIKEQYEAEAKDKGLYIKMYTNDTEIPREKNYEMTDATFDNHYVTVTGVIRNSIEDRTWLQVSSWGRKFYIDYNEYLYYMQTYASMGGAATNILHITAK